MENSKKILKTLWSLRKFKSFLRVLKGSIYWFSQNELLQLANDTETDKGFFGHGYVRVYDSLLKKRRNEIKSLCEIGLLRHRIQIDNKKDVYEDAPSLKMWRLYFPNARIVGFDIKKFKQPIDKNCTIVQGDQKLRNDLKKIIKEQYEFDIIIDDALHASEHQQISLSFLFPHLTSGGMYFIEDLQYQPQEFEKNNLSKTIKILKKFKETGIWSSPVSSSKEKQTLESQIGDIFFFDSLKGKDVIKSSDALAVIVKK